MNYRCVHILLLKRKQHGIGSEIKCSLKQKKQKRRRKFWQCYGFVFIAADTWQFLLKFVGGRLPCRFVSWWPWEWRRWLWQTLQVASTRSTRQVTWCSSKITSTCLDSLVNVCWLAKMIHGLSATASLSEMICSFCLSIMVFILSTGKNNPVCPLWHTPCQLVRIILFVHYGIHLASWWE